MIKVGDWIQIVGNLYAGNGLKDGDICKVQALYHRQGKERPVVEVSKYGWRPTSIFYPHLDREKLYYALASGGWEEADEPLIDEPTPAPTHDPKRWAVLCDGDEPRFYSSYEAAKNSAKKLCAQGDDTYYVYVCKGRFEVGAPEWKECPE